MSDKEKFTIDDEYVAIPEVILPGHKPKEEVSEEATKEENGKPGMPDLKSENLAMPEIRISEVDEKK